jgi:hypothetical protein
LGSGNVPTSTPVKTATTGPSLTPSRTNTTGPTATRTSTPAVTNTPTRTSTAGPTATRTNTPLPGNTPTRTPTVAASNTPVTGGACSPVTSTITAPFTFDGAGTFCWQASSLATYINSWNTTSITLNGVNVTNVYVGAGSYPAKIGGFYYVGYNSSVAWGHFEAK